MRSWTGTPLAVLASVLTLLLAGCGSEPLCGETEEGEEIPICSYDIEGVEFLYCPGDHWAAPECVSCGCTGDGRVLCTENQCEGPTGGTNTGS